MGRVCGKTWLFRCFKFTLKTTLYLSAWESLIANLGHFPLEFFSQICTQDSLWHVLGPFLVKFDISQFLVTPGPFKYLCQNIGVSENQFFLYEGVVTLQWGLGILGGQMAGLYGGTIFEGVWDTWGLWQGFESKGSAFRWFLTHLQQLRGYSALTDFIKHQSIDAA